MPFSLEIQNFGKLAHANIDIGNLTVFAGPNNTGKSHVSKLMYSLFDAMNANHAKVHVENLLQPINGNLNFLGTIDDTNETASLSSLRNLLVEMSQIVDSRSSGNNEIATLGQLYPTLRELADKVKHQYETLRPSFERWWKHMDPTSFSFIEENILKGMYENICKLHSEINEATPRSFITTGIRYKIHQNLIDNFQVPNVVDLKKDKNFITLINIAGIGNFQIGPKQIKFSIQYAGLFQLQEYSKVIYLESPIQWKLKNALEITQNHPRFFYSDRDRLSGVPGYFYDLVSALREQYSGGMAFPDLFEKLTNETVLGGKLTISENGELFFREREKHFPLILTATGVANLGMLALLIERKVLDKGTFLFIDEPEAHLHPAWQVVMAETLFELARQGVNVVIATHSVDILKWIEVRTKQHPEDKQLIALNHFTPNGVKNDEEDFEVKLAGIKTSLTEPFLNLHLKGLGL